MKGNKKMKIAFDGQLLLKGDKTGIAWCADNLIKELSMLENTDCMLNIFSANYHKVISDSLKDYQVAGCQIQECKWFYYTLYRLLWSLFPLSYTFFFPKQTNITQFFNYIIPPGVHGKKVVFVHDMAYLAYPETVHPKTRRWLTLHLKKSCKRADKIITISRFSKQEIIKYLHIPEEKIVIMPIGVNHKLYHPNYTQQEVNVVKKKYQIKGAYFLYLGTLEPRKNIEQLIKAYALFTKQTTTPPKLVLAGRKGWMYEKIFEKVSKYKLEKLVIFTGYIEEQESPLLMKGAQAFFFPSLYEGFGMPPLEAMACGTPVVVSNVASLPEVVENAGILVNPFQAEELYHAMKKIYDQESFRKELIEKSIQQAQKFTWKNSVKILMKTYQQLLDDIKI